MIDLISAIPVLGPLLATILPFVVVLGIVVFIHEFGHYIVGRWCGIHAEVFSLGFGKELYARTDRRGTRWRIGLLPLGGYVKFLGDADGSSRPDQASVEGMDAAERARSFPGAALWKRALTVLAGPVANFLLSIAIYCALVFWTGVAVEEARLGALPESVQGETPLREGDVVTALNGQPVGSYAELMRVFSEIDLSQPATYTVERDGEAMDLVVERPRPPLVAGVRPLSGASRAGIREGDLLLTAAGVPLVDFDTLRETVAASEGEPLEIGLRRGAEEMVLTMVPTEEDVPQPDGTFARQVIIGVSIAPYLTPETRSPGPVEALGIGVSRTWAIITGTFDGIGHMIAGNISPSNLQGPVGIAQVSGETAGQGILNFVLLIALISTAIGLMNLFPIPVLDGGHLVFYAIEAVTGRTPSGRWVDVAMGIGLAMVLSLMLFATYNDITRL
ncbi:RIP metalloprotease RseP [Roseobacter sp. HKCCA0434]|uniref:RIP metalloprotease RseP n=1 Tax=Roseobacter sp. HKCCA0434 TaxID=3079297 RepID=UPI002905F292|nr:RIP metalloprotease RseP [Roseobacter sp. HKCCA0434]